MKRCNEQRSGCPINLTLEILGDRWSLLIIRDMIFGNRRHFNELLAQSNEGIASNILADRLRRLVEQGIISKSGDRSHKQKMLYSLTEQGIQLVPVLAQIGAWGSRFLPASRELSIRAKVLEKGGPRMWTALMAELRETHLGKVRRGPSNSIALKLQKAYEAAVRKRAPANSAATRLPRRV